MFIAKVPGINGLGKTKGCEKAPDKILSTLKEEIFSNESGKPIDSSELDLEEIHLDNSNLKLTNDLIYRNALDIFKENSKTVFLGGDHSISYSLTKAFLDYYKSSEDEPCLIVFDAHPDCMPSLKEPTHEVCSLGASHKEWLRKLIDYGFPPKNVLLVGVRNSDKAELDFLNQKRIRMISMNQLLDNLEDSCDIIMEFARAKELYVSIDIDVLDPAFASAVAYAEPGGLSSREFLYLIQRINKIKTLRAVDITEINPEKDTDNKTIKLGAKILSELL